MAAVKNQLQGLRVLMSSLYDRVILHDVMPFDELKEWKEINDRAIRNGHLGIAP